MNRDQVKGRAKQALGKTKEVAGKALGNSRIEGTGSAQKAAGKVQARYGDARSDLKRSSR